MESISLVPAIENLLQHPDKEKKAEGLDLISQNIGLVGGFLSDVIPHLKPEDHPEKAEYVHLLLSMVCFYTQRYNESVNHAILAKDVWHSAAKDHDKSVSLYFEESRHRLIRRYIETAKEERNEELSQFIQELAAQESPNSYSLLGLFLVTKDLAAIERFLRSGAHVLEESLAPEFIIEGAKRERFYRQLLSVLASIWEESPKETYSLVFFKALADAYLVNRSEDKLVALINYLAERRKEAALFVAFLVHDKSPVLSQRIAGQAKDAQAHALLTGKFQSEVYQRFLTDKNNISFSLLSDLSKSQSSKLSMNHMSLSFCNGFMSGKTCNDTYLRKNLEWMKQAKNWSKFVVASSFGMIHTDSEDPFEVLRHYLPMASIVDTEKDDPESGGALFALGLIAVNSPTIADSFLGSFFDAESKSSRSNVLYGACLGLGLTRLGTADTETINKFKNILYSDNVTVSEAAAYAIGLTTAGNFDLDLAREVLTYARDTEHEKISRAVGVGVALKCIGIASSEPPQAFSQLLDELLGDINPIIRYSGVLSFGAAYVGTGDLSAVRKLLSVISTDSSEDVKRIAVFAIGLILSDQSGSGCLLEEDKTSELCSVLEPLAQSHSAYVRAGVALTLGMFQVGSGCKKSLALIETLMYDTTTYVRQHASIGAGFLLMQLNIRDDPVFKRVIEHMHSMTRRKSESGAARFGALLGRAILDACGRNGTISIYGMSRDISVKSVCGAILFSQYWYWYPVVPFITLCMRPTLLLAADTNLNILEDFQVEVEGPSTPFKMESVLPNEHAKSHKKFKIIPLAGEKPQEEVKEEEKEVVVEVEEKSHVVKNNERFTTLQQKRSGLADQPSILFFPAASQSNPANNQ
ncbi:26S proteasome regulatory subunit N2 [Nematocida homosporus]|uniref:26S proteasome regulatory subunit N2 n=1 Tax=Nematocida homosporus TaxID=1912981 RepID=UPI0022202803|nr:26S proteasome regulatory subunit N2 [Nematocida homosporus]KAI5186494.1 26S proteasome regulatory subunit N2 [Nematocida homosporus]